MQCFTFQYAAFVAAFFFWNFLWFLPAFWKTPGIFFLIFFDTFTGVFQMPGKGTEAPEKGTQAPGKGTQAPGKVPN